jgi:hypothetical protein
MANLRKSLPLIITNQESSWDGMRVTAESTGPWGGCTLCFMLTEWINEETPWRATYNEEWDEISMDSPYRPTKQYGLSIQDVNLSDFELADPQFCELLKATLLERWHDHHKIRRH